MMAAEHHARKKKYMAQVVEAISRAVAETIIAHNTMAPMFGTTQVCFCALPNLVLPWLSNPAHTQFGAKK